MRPLLVVLALIAAVAAGGILAGPLLNADRHEERSRYLRFSPGQRSPTA
jgi:hypothetical protein